MRLIIDKQTVMIATLSIPLKGFEADAQEFRFHVDDDFFKNWEESDIKGGDVDVRVVVHCVEGVYRLDFALEGTIVVLCDRCLDEMTLPVQTDYVLKVKYGSEYNDDDDELIVIAEEDNSFDCSNVVYDTLALSVPYNHSHEDESECNAQMMSILKAHSVDEISEEETIDDNQNEGEMVDPRWEALRKLKKE